MSVSAHKLIELDRDGVLQNNGKDVIESREYECDSPELNQAIGWDAAVNKLSIVADVEALAKILMNEYDDDDNWDDNNESARRKHKWWIGNAKAILETMPQWCSLKKGE